MATDMDRAFAAVLGLSNVTDARGIIERISEARTIRNYTGRQRFFIDSVGTLRDLALDEGAGTIVAGRRAINTLQPHRPGEEGAYGVVHRSADNTLVYKSIRFPKSPPGRNAHQEAAIQANIATSRTDPYAYFEKKIRDVYIETFIQVIISNDPIVGHYIPRLRGLFRDPSVTRGRGTNAGRILERYTLFITMDPNPVRLEDHLNRLRDTNGGILELRSFGRLLIELGETLARLRTAYGFSHRDLHVGNIMVSADGHLRLIDFGYSCLTYGGQTYRSVRMNERAAEGCIAGFDLAILFTHIYANYRGAMSPETTRFFETNMGSVGAPFNMLGHGDDFARNNTAHPHHAFYYWEMDTLVPTPAGQRRLDTLLASLPVLDPAQMPGIVRRAMDAPRMGAPPAMVMGPGPAAGLFSPGLRRRGAAGTGIAGTGTAGTAATRGMCDGIYNATLGWCYPRTWGANKTARRGRKARHGRKTIKTRKSRSNRK